MKQRFTGKVVIVTGASEGIGRALSLGFAREGARVVLSARSEERLKSAVYEITQNGGMAIYVKADVSQRQEVENLFKCAIEKFSRVDILVNNAGVGLYGDLEMLDDESLNRVFRVNVMGPLYCIQSAIPAMKKQGGGHIVNISSVAGRRAMPGFGGYAMTKFALHALSESLRTELMPWNIHVTVISPGLIRTEFSKHAVRPAGASAAFSMESRRMTPEVCAAKIIDAVYCRKREQVITLGGRILVFLNRFSPRLTDWIIARAAPLLRGNKKG
ncbi:MAG TPA: SDR family oxidoreductase [bacterium]